MFYTFICCSYSIIFLLDLFDFCSLVWALGAAHPSFPVAALLALGAGFAVSNLPATVNALFPCTVLTLLVDVWIKVSSPFLGVGLLGV